MKSHWPRLSVAAAITVTVACSGPASQVTKQSKTAAAQPKEARSTPKSAACPTGKAVVLRASKTLRVDVPTAFKKAKDGDQITLCPGRALLKESLQMKGRSNVTITGNKTSLVAKGDFPVVQFFQCQSVTISGVHIVHEIGEWCAQGCLEIYESKNMTVKHCDLDGSGYFGVVTNRVSESAIIDNTIHNCHYGVAIYKSKGLQLRGNTFSNNRGNDIEIQGDAVINDVRADNTFVAKKLTEGASKPTSSNGKK